jgi:hypothetical protein
MADLLPCPLCQGTVDHWSDHFYCDACKCDFVFYDGDGNPTAPLERFNRRTPPPETAKLLRSLDEDCEEMDSVEYSEYLLSPSLVAKAKAEWPNKKAPA